MARKAQTAEPTKCPVNHETFRRSAKPLMITVNSAPPMAATPKEFSTGSFGWYLSGKTSIEVNGELITVQIGCNLIAVGSKNAK